MLVGCVIFWGIREKGCFGWSGILIHVIYLFLFGVIFVDLHKYNWWSWRRLMVDWYELWRALRVWIYGLFLCYSDFKKFLVSHKWKDDWITSFHGIKFSAGRHRSFLVFRLFNSYSEKLSCSIPTSRSLPHIVVISQYEWSIVDIVIKFVSISASFGVHYLVLWFYCNFLIWFSGGLIFNVS